MDTAKTQIAQEQIQALQEKIKNMSPEELKEFQKGQCIFCQIIDGKVQSKKIYWDETTLAILDINPANPGHVLLMTKEHYSIMPQIPEEEIAHIFNVAKALSNTILRSLEAQGTNLIVANGVAAGQRAQHFMIHLIPRREGDALEFKLPQRQMSEQEIEDVSGRITNALNSMSGIEKIEKSEIKKTSEIKRDREKVAEKSDINLDEIAKLLGAK